MNHRENAHAAALCALLAALGTAVMLAAGLIPVLTYCSPLIASLFLIPVHREYGKGRAWMTWAATALLSGILCADKEAAFFYVFLGFYPILKPSFDRAGRFGGFAAKLLFFAAALLAMYSLILFVLGLDIALEGKRSILALCFALAAVMLVFDLVLRRMTLLYERRIRKVFFKRNR